MTRKDYEFIARVLCDFNRRCADPTLPNVPRWVAARDITITFMDALGDENPHFDNKKFLKAAGMID